ncbi:MAG: hypothetical protein ACOC3D_05105 [Pseudomonadota bacterium]
MMNKTGDAVPRDDDLRAQIDALRADLEKITETLLRSGSQSASRVVDDLREVGSRAVDETRARVESGRAYGEQKMEGAEAWVRRNPLLAVSCALGTGFLLAHLRGRG